MPSFPFDEQKTVSVILYILKKIGGKCDYHKLFKIMYYADQKHMVKYGRPVIGDSYVAMPNGPVPSITYDGVKAVKNPKRYNFPLFASNFRNEGYSIVSKNEPDMDELSKSDINCLEASIKENSILSFDDLTTKSHAYAYNRVNKDSAMSTLDIAQEGGANVEMRNYIRENSAEHHCAL